ncbi:MAG TPA: 4'-phosphopantetheinyl transferase superfamily protein [Candidatus Limnocylindria bacterium]|nr:4'-phosphopantetheinyl transferase superfamily protein [Candidatus Limnocylindria bacterium]
MSKWSEPQEWPALGAEQVHVWLAHLPSQRAHAPRFLEVLSPQELERAGRFRFETLRERAHFTRGILRLLLSRYVKTPPREITFIENAHGKPGIERPPGTGLFFNMSHSGEHAAWAITRLGEVGVDIEQARDDMSRLENIARRYFAPGEQKQLSALPKSEQTRGFFELWTRKEAFVKARGDGLFSGLDQFEVSLADARLLSINLEDAGHWWMSALPPLPGYAGAVVVKTPSCSPRFWNWNAGLLE